MNRKTFVEKPLPAVSGNFASQGNDPLMKSLWEDVKALAKGELPSLRHRGKVIQAPNGGMGFSRWPSDKALDWAVAVYDQLGGKWGNYRMAKIPGGRAEGKSPKDFDPRQLKLGIEVELEHTGDRELAREIAMDHLAEIPDYYTRLLRMEAKAKKANAAPTLISQRKFKAPGTEVFLFLTSYANRQYLIRVDISNSMGFELLASGPKSATAFQSLGDLILKGEDLYAGEFTEVHVSHGETESLFKAVTQGRFAVKFPEEDNDPDLENFFAHFKQFLREWTLNGSGNDKKFPILHHPYWDRYQESLHEVLKKEHGSTITLYRGVHGDFVDEIGDTKPVYRFSSWTADKNVARDFARYGFIGDLHSGFATKVRRKGKWAVVSAVFPVESVVMAPVFVSALKEPELLVKQLSGQDEYVIHSPAPRVRVKVIARSK